MDLTTRPPLRLQHPVVAPGDETLRIDLGQPVTALAISPQGLVALGTHQGLISVHDAHSGVKRAQLRGHRRRIHGLAFSEDGEVLYSASRDGALRRWGVLVGAGEQVWRGRLSLNTCAAGGGRVLAAGDDGVVRVFLANQLEAELRGHRGMVTTVAVLPCGQRAVSGGVDGLVILWDLQLGSGRRLYRHGGAVTDCALSADGTLLLSSSTDGQLVVWDLAADRRVGSLAAHEGPITSCALSGDGGRALSGAPDRTVAVWDLATGARTHTFYSHDRDVLAVGWQGGRVWSAAADRSARCWALSASPDIPEYRLRHLDAVTDCTVVAEHGWLISTSLDYTIQVWDAETGSSHQTLRGHHGAVKSVALSPGGRVLASVANDGEVRLWSLRGDRWQAGMSFSAGQGPLSRCLFLSDGLLLTAGRDGPLRIWSLLTGRPLYELSGHSSTTLGCAVRPDGQIVTASSDGELVLWSAGERACARPPSGVPITDCAVHPDGERIVYTAQDGGVWLWAPQPDGGASTLLYCHAGIARALAVSEQGLLLSVGDDRTLQLYDLETASHTEMKLTWPLRAVSAGDGCVAVGDQAGNLWVFARGG